MAHVIAVFNLSKEVPSPKVKGIKTGYSPHHKFKNIDYFVSGQHKYQEDRVYYPGELIIAAVTFTSWEYINKEIKVGEKFEVREMNRIDGYGEIIEILN